MKFTILVADDEKNIREGLREALVLDGLRGGPAADGKEALDALGRGEVDLVITDLKMPRLSGEELLRRVSADYPTVPVIILTGHGTIESAVQAMHDGAYDFLTKPVEPRRLACWCKRALGTRELALQNRELQEELERRSQFSNIIGRSARDAPGLRPGAPGRPGAHLRADHGRERGRQGDDRRGAALQLAAPGEGASSSCTARRSPRRCSRASCSATRRAPSRARSRASGAGSSSPTSARSSSTRSARSTRTVQVKLLRVLEERKFERVGGEETIEVDVRIDRRHQPGPDEGHRAGQLPGGPLLPAERRQHPHPAPAGAHGGHPAAHGRVPEGVQRGERQDDRGHRPEGARRPARLTPGPATSASCATPSRAPWCCARAPSSGSTTCRRTSAGKRAGRRCACPSAPRLADAEKELIRSTLAREGGNKSRAADVLGIGRKTLHRKLQEYGLGQQ